jgi:hypothetical protein
MGGVGVVGVTLAEGVGGCVNKLGKGAFGFTVLVVVVVAVICCKALAVGAVEEALSCGGDVNKVFVLGAALVLYDDKRRVIISYLDIAKSVRFGKLGMIWVNVSIIF